MSIPVTLNGRLGTDPEFKISQAGNAVCHLRIVTSGRKKVGDTWEDVDTSWWNVTLFRQAAEYAATLTKGQRVIAVGRAVERQWETPEGEKRRNVEIIADDIAGIPRPESRPAASQPADDPWASETPF